MKSEMFALMFICMLTKKSPISADNRANMIYMFELFCTGDTFFCSPSEILVTLFRKSVRGQPLFY